MSEAIARLREKAADHQDWRSRYVRMALARPGADLDEARLEELERLLAERPEKEETVSPLKVFSEAMDKKLRRTLTADEYDQFSKSLDQDRIHTWNTLRTAMAQTVVPEKLKLPKLPKKTGHQAQTEMTLQILKLLAQSERNRAPQEVRADLQELQKARTAGGRAGARLKHLLQRLERKT